MWCGRFVGFFGGVHLFRPVVVSLLLLACGSGQHGPQGNEPGLQTSGGSAAAGGPGGTSGASANSAGTENAAGATQVPDEPGSCSDKLRNQNESDVDCGGACPACGDGQACQQAHDCDSGLCDSATCVAASCGDGNQNGSESDVDCGGSCGPCPVEGVCSSSADCASLVCVDQHCAAADCSDGTKNGSETDTDCGGACPACELGLGCSLGADCVTGVCQEHCVPQGCSDGIQNQAESDVDCGGSCGPCSTDQTCIIAGDCASRVCGDGLCVEASCDDATKNGLESDVDCGDKCSGCANGAPCGVAADCSSKVCEGGACQPASCADHVKNASETAIDCGPGCAPCGAGQGCSADLDCLSGRCKDGACLEAVCNDGLKNGTETDNDCGGACTPCKTQGSCKVNGDCHSQVCGNGQCSAPTCKDVVKNGNETAIDCGGGTCKPCGLAATCSKNEDCTTASCSGGRCGLAHFDLNANWRYRAVGNGSIEHADVDGDGDQDLIGTSQNGGEVHVMANDGTGHFELADVIAIDENGTLGDLAVNDVNEDGLLDVLLPTSNQQGYGSLFVSLGEVGGSFGPAAKYTNTRLSRMLVGDLDCDGHPDVLQSGLVLRGDGKGKFAAPAALSGAPNTVHAMGDMNGDKKLDLLNSVIDGVQTWLNDGSGSFHAGPKGNCYHAGDPVDIDGDGDLDTLNESAACSNDGSGKLTSENVFNTSAYPSTFAPVDFNRDGLMDVAWESNVVEGPLRATMLLNRGKYGFARSSAPPVGMDTKSTTAADFDGDGVPDIAMGGLAIYNAYGGIQIMRGLGDGRFRNPPTSRGQTGANLLTSDLDGDGWPDLLSSQLELFLMHGDLEIGDIQPPADVGSSQTRLADMDGDGDLDAVTTGKFKGSVQVLLRTGPTKFAAPVSYSHGDTTDAGSGLGSIATGDFDGDGDIDVAAACFGAIYQSGFAVSGEIAIFLNRGDGTLVMSRMLKAGFDHPLRIESITRFGDARPSLVILDSDSVLLAPAQGGGNFGTPWSLGQVSGSAAIATGDINGDGYLDIAIAGGTDRANVRPENWYPRDYIPGTVVVFFDSAQGWFTKSANVGAAPVDVSAGDLDGDGRDDLAVSCKADGSLAVIRAIGANGGLVSESYGLDQMLRASVIVDIDRDGKRDIVVAGAGLTVIRNLSESPPAEPTPQPTSTCGNGAREGIEDCDRTDLGGQSCASLVAASATGALKCSAFCAFDLSGCTPSTACGAPGQFQENAPWPMSGRCQDHAGRSDQNGPQTAALRWSYATSAQELGGPGVSAAGDVIVAGSDSVAYAITAGGKLNYQAQLRHGSTKVPAIDPFGQVWLAGDAGDIDSFHVGIGSYLSETNRLGIVTSIALARGPLEGMRSFGSGFGFAAHRGFATSLTTDSAVTTTPTVASDGTQYFATLQGTVYATSIDDPNPSSGNYKVSVHWQLHLDHPVYADMALSVSGMLYVPLSTGTLYALRPSGAVAWRFDAGLGLGAPALTPDGTIVVTTSDKLLAINPDGTLAWSLAGAFVGSTPSVGKDGKIYVGVDGCSLAAVSTAGKLLFKVVPPGAAPQSRRLPQPALTSSTAYFAAGGSLYAVGP